MKEVVLRVKEDSVEEFLNKINIPDYLHDYYTDVHVLDMLKIPINSPSPYEKFICLQAGSTIFAKCEVYYFDEEDVFVSKSKMRMLEPTIEGNPNLKAGEWADFDNTPKTLEEKLTRLNRISKIFTDMSSEFEKIAKSLEGIDPAVFSSPDLPRIIPSPNVIEEECDEDDFFFIPERYKEVITKGYSWKFIDGNDRNEEEFKTFYQAYDCVFDDVGAWFYVNSSDENGAFRDENVFNNGGTSKDEVFHVAELFAVKLIKHLFKNFMKDVQDERLLKFRRDQMKWLDFVCDVRQKGVSTLDEYVLSRTILKSEGFKTAYLQTDEVGTISIEEKRIVQCLVYLGNFYNTSFLDRIIEELKYVMDVQPIFDALDVFALQNLS